MERKESSRHLAAILFTDIVGYTQMMQRDENAALASVRRHHELLEKTVLAHDGEIYQYYGDGSLSIFNSATQAVQCAYDLQKQLLSEPRVLIRTGIHIGEIYTEGGKIFGDGVNIASRIESIAQGGTVLFSRDVYEKVRNNTSFQIKSIGTFEFKNVDDPVGVYALVNPEIITPDSKITEGKLKEQHKKIQKPGFIVGLILGLAIITILGWQLTGKNNYTWEEEKSVAVLPFKNESNGEAVDFLSTGIADDILTQLAAINGLKVIAQASSLKYKDSDKDLMTIARDLGVTSLLNGKISKHENSLRVTVELIKASDESIIWRESFDREFEDILNLQKEVALEVSQKLQVSLTPALASSLSDRVNVNPEAYVNYQKGQELLKRSSGTLEDMQQAKMYFEKAIDEDSTFSRAWVGLADAIIESIFWHRIDDKGATYTAKQAALRGLQLDPRSGEAYGALGAVYLFEKDLNSAEKNLRRSIELNPNYTFAYERLAWIELFQGREEAAFRMYDKILILDPLSTRLKGSMGSIYYFEGRYKEGIEMMQSFLKDHPGDNFILWSLGYCYAGNDEYLKAIETFHQRTLGTKTNWALAYCYSKLGNKEEVKKILDYHIQRKKTGHVPDFMMAVQYAAIGDIEKALDYLERSAYDSNENWFILGLERDKMLDPLRNEKRFQELLRKVREDYKF